MFRRAAWAAVGGFDEGPSGSHALDFWTSVIERGFCGGIPPVPLSLRSLSPPTALRGRHLASTEQFYRKHADTLAAHAERMLLAKEEALLAERDRHEQLSGRKQALMAELQRLQGEIDQTLRDLEAFGRSRVELGDLRRTSPISPVWGLDRGMPVDRYYIAQFLRRHQSAVHGRVLEVKDAGYTRDIGGDRVTSSDVLDVDPGNELATILADLTLPGAISSDTYDCFILTQTLGLIYDVRAALTNAYQALKPGGVLLCTVPASGRISYERPGLDGDYWRFTEASIRRLFSEVFSVDAFEITGFGNVLSCTAFLHGLAHHELTRDELNAIDPFFPIVYGIRAEKRIPLANGAPALRKDRTGRLQRGAPAPGAILMYHRIAPDDGNNDGPSVTLNNFRSHMEHLRRNAYTVLSLREMAQAIRQGDLPERSIALTFDDGYVDALTCVSPILIECGFHATFFVVGEALDGQHEFWWDTLDRVFCTGGSTRTRLKIDVPSGPMELPTRTSADRLIAHHRVREIFYRLGRTDRDAVLRSLLDWSGLGQRSESAVRPMTSVELGKLAALPGIHIGAHTASHSWLPDQTPQNMVVEIAECKTRLEGIVHRQVTSFSYPYGAYDPTTVEAVQRAGFEEAVTAEGRPVSLTDNCLMLPRQAIRNSDEDAFADCLREIYDKSAVVEPT